MSNKILINKLEQFDDYVGKNLFVSEPFKVTKERIQEFCRSIDNDEWIHWDEERCKASPHVGAIIAPAFMSPALLSKLYFDNVDIDFQKLNGLFLGTDRIRLLNPVKADSELVLSVEIDHIVPKEKGIAVHYNFVFTIVDENVPASLGNFIIRYWN